MIPSPANPTNDATLQGLDILIEDPGQPAVVVVPYEDYDAIREALEDLRDSRTRAAAMEEYRQNPTAARP